MSEIYEEVLRRNEPKNYTVQWQTIIGIKEKSTYFPSFEEADLFADSLRNAEGVSSVLILRAGRHPSAARWKPTQSKRFKVVQRNTNEIVLNDKAWTVPEGYVDGDADKHGPVEMPSLINRIQERSNKEKGEWAKNNNFDNRTCIWQ